MEDVREDPALRRLVDVPGVLGGEQRDHGAPRLAHDLPDQVESVRRIQPEPDECDVRPLSSGHGSNLLHVDLARDHLVPELCHDSRQELEPLAPLVGDEHSEVPGLVVVHLCRFAPFERSRIVRV